MKKYNEALESYNHAIQINPEESNYFFIRANALVEANRFQEAIENFENAI